MNIHAPVWGENASKRHKFSLSEAMDLVDAGILPRDGAYELIDGDVIEMAPEGPAHRRYQHALIRWIIPRLPDHLAFAVDQTLPVDRHNGPSPDFYVFPAEVHEDSLAPGDVRWVIEIADTSLAYDQAVKAPLYAGHGIADYWIVDVNANTIAVLRDPRDGVYLSERVFAADEEVAPLCAPGLGLRLSALPRLG